MCVKNTWYDQSEEWQKSILIILLHWIYQQVSRDKIETAMNIKAVINSYAHSLDDLSMYEVNNQRYTATLKSIKLNWMSDYFLFILFSLLLSHCENEKDLVQKDNSNDLLHTDDDMNLSSFNEINEEKMKLRCSLYALTMTDFERCIN